jgi:hypothetical protein
MAGEAHLILGRPLTPPVCTVAADAGQPQEVCAGQPVTLDGSGSTVTGCTQTPQYRWLLAGSVVRDWSADPVATVVAFVDSLYTLEVRCGDCAGPCLGSATVQVTVKPDPIPPDQGNVVRAVKQLPDVALSFPGAPATAWRLYRDLVKTQLGTSPLVPDTIVTSFTDPGSVPPPPALWFYRLKGLSPCSSTPGP